jgi:hypothetical protein
MSIIIGASLVVVGVCVGGVIMGLLAAGGRDERRMEVADALAAMWDRLDVVRAALIQAAFHAHEGGDVETARIQVHYASLTTAEVIDGVRYLAELLDMRSILDSWKTCDTDGAPVANTGDGGTASDAPATGGCVNGIGAVKAGCPVRQSIASK